MRSIGGQPAAKPARRKIQAWRAARLRASGFDRALAEEIAADGRYDLHSLLELVDRGCPAELAARILAPLETEEASVC
jgi:hypothetical protein